MAATVDCLGCGRAIPLGQSRCVECAPRRPAWQGYRGYRAERPAVLVEGAVCWMCHEPGRPGDPLTTDHRIPRARGGSDHRTNLLPAHASCNSARGAREPRAPRGIRVL